MNSPIATNSDTPVEMVAPEKAEPRPEELVEEAVPVMKPTPQPANVEKATETIKSTSEVVETKDSPTGVGEFPAEDKGTTIAPKARRPAKFMSAPSSTDIMAKVVVAEDKNEEISETGAASVKPDKRCDPPKQIQNDKKEENTEEKAKIPVVSAGDTESKLTKTKVEVPPDCPGTEESKLAASNVEGPADTADNKESKPAESTFEIPAESADDEEFKLAMEMAIAVAQNPNMTPDEIQMLMKQKNEQSKMVEEFSKENEEKIKQNQDKVRGRARRENSWWHAAAKKAEEMKDRAERRIYADQIRKDEGIIEIRRKFKILKKTLKAHRLQGNRVETRHAFKRQRMERQLMQTSDRLKKTSFMFTQSNYNVQEYLKAMMRASKKWRKKGSDDELTLEAQLCRNMHQMLALEKQKAKSKKNTKEMKKYLQRCKGWLCDKKAFCEMNQMTLDATQNSMMILYQDTIKRHDALITKLKASDEFKNVDLSDVDVSHVDLPIFDRDAAMNAMRGLPITDSIRVKKEQLDREHPDEEQQEKEFKALAEAESRRALLKKYDEQQQEVNEHGRPELYVSTQDDISVSSHLSDPDGSQSMMMNEDSDTDLGYGHDAPWIASATNLDAVEEDSFSKLEEKKITAKPGPLIDSISELEETEDVEDNEEEKQSLPRRRSKDGAPAGSGPSGKSFATVATETTSVTLDSPKE